MAIVIWYNMTMYDAFLLSVFGGTDLELEGIFRFVLFLLVLFCIHLLVKGYTSRIKAKCEKELNEFRSIVEETMKEKVKLQHDYVQVRKEFDEMQTKFANKNMNSAALQHRLHQMEGQVTILASDLSRTTSDRDRLGRERNELDAECRRLRARSEDILPIQHRLDQEVMDRIDAENQLKATTEELKLKSRLHHEEILEMRSKRQAELQEVDDRLHEEYKRKLKQHGKEYEAKLRASNEKLENSYNTKAAELKSELNLAHSSLSAKQQELSSIHLRLECALKTISQLERERQLEEERQRSSSSSPPSTDTEDVYDFNSIVNGDVEILEDAPDGTFIRLKNNGDEEVSLSRWTLTKQSGGSQTTHKFHRTMKIKGKETVTIWSWDAAGVRHKPPTSIVMKGQKWLSADNVVTTLINDDGDEMAKRETQICHVLD